MSTRLRRALVFAAVLVGTVAGVGAAPTPTIDLAPSQKTPTNAEPVRFSIVFSESVTAFAADDVIPSRGLVSSLVETTPLDGTAFEVGVASIAGDGPVCVSIPAGAAFGVDGAPSAPASSDGACVVIDRTAPSPPEIAAPADGYATAASAPKFSWAASADPSGIKNYRVVIEGPTSRDTYTTRTSYSPSLGEGIYAWRVNCRDQIGNVSSWTASRTIVVDRTAPESVSLTSPTHAADVWTRCDAIAVETSGGSDALSGLAGYAVAWSQDPSGSLPGSANRGPEWLGEAFPVSNDGTWWCRVAAVDRAGNRGAPAVAGPFLVDRAPPELAGLEDTILLPNDFGLLAATADWTHVSVADALDPCPSVSFSVPTGSLLPIGRSEMTVTLADHAGNVRTQKVTVLVYNTEPPVVTVLRPARGECFALGQDTDPDWTVSSLAPIATARAEGLVAGRLDTSIPGRHTFFVSVVDTTGLSASAEVEYVVKYARRDVAFLRVLPNGAEEPVPPSRDAEAPLPVLRSSDWLRVRCMVDEVATSSPRAVVTFSLTREDPENPQVPVVERLGVLAADGAARSLDLPLVVFPPGRYTLWLGFVDETNVGFPFELVP